MSPSEVFKICNSLAFFTWILIIIAPWWKYTSRIVIGIVVTLLAICYTYYISQSLNLEDLNSFGTLEGVMQLFTNEFAVLGGWIHYLAFDLMVGWFIAFDSKRKGISRFLIIPCFLCTFMLGPFGLLLYLILRMVSTKTYFVDFENDTV